MSGAGPTDGFFYNFDQSPKVHDRVMDLTGADAATNIG